MSYELFDTGEVNDFRDTPEVWQRFVTELEQSTPGAESTTMVEWSHIINQELAKWGAHSEDRYGETSGLITGFKLIFETEEQATQFVLRWA